MDTKFFKMSHFIVLFYVLAWISAPVARHGWRLWQIKAGTRIFLFAEVSALGEPLALTNHQNKYGGCFLVMLGHFSVFFLGLPWFSLPLGNASFCLALPFGRVSAQEESLAPRSDQNKVFGIFLSVLGHFSCVPWAWASARGVGRGDWEWGDSM